MRSSVILEKKSNVLNFVSMTEGQVAYVQLDRNWFNPVDSSSTKRYDDSRDCYAFEYPYYVKVRASGWDGTKVTAWIVTPITEAFWIHRGADADGNPVYDKYPAGTIQVRIFYFSIQSCFYGIYNFPWELEISRQ